jgi:serine O-acetyltransferase
MSWSRCRTLIASDLWRYAGAADRRLFWTHFFVTPGFRYTALLRCYQWAREQSWCAFGLRQTLSCLLRHYSIRFGIDISPDACIGSGFYIGHFGGIVVNRDVVIGDNCNLSHRVTLGQLNRGERAGCPVIGSNVYIAPGAVVIGRIHVGDHAAIGANAVVISDVATHTTVGGVPAREISSSGSEGYVNRTDYPPVLSR